MTGSTKDERFIIRVYEVALNTGDINTPVDRYHVGKTINQSERMVDTICALLIRANFIKRADGSNIYLTPQGEQLALRLLSEN